MTYPCCDHCLTKWGQCADVADGGHREPCDTPGCEANVPRVPDPPLVEIVLVRREDML